jgi:hypothetical protein
MTLDRQFVGAENRVTSGDLLGFVDLSVYGLRRSLTDCRRDMLDALV